jgi:methylenetetrahydrofolate reductase (NADPH)
MPRRPDSLNAGVSSASSSPHFRPATRARGVSQDVDVLLTKEVAGANLAITQLFWHADDYLSFVESARVGGVNIPILPGIMRVTTPERLSRLQALTGVEAPISLRHPS